MKTNSKKNVIILSGGLDSVVLLHQRARDIALAITFEYGANNQRREVECAKEHCEALGVEHIIIPIPDIFRHSRSSLLQGAAAVPESADEREISSTVVPFRNGVMLAIAASIADSRGLKGVMIANHFEPVDTYPDCSVTFIRAMNKATRAGTRSKVEVISPFEYISKADIVKIGATIGVDFAKTYTCYKGGAKHCGRCYTCQARREAFKTAGVEDPTEYEN